MHFHQSDNHVAEETESEKYLKTLKSDPSRLNTKKVFEGHFYVDYFNYQMRDFRYTDYTFAEMTIPFITLTYESNYVVVDYECSIIDVISYVMKFIVKEKEIDVGGGFTFGSYVVLFIIILIFKEVRENLNGKCVMIYSLVKCTQYIHLFFSQRVQLGYLLMYLENVETHSGFMWLMIISYDCWKTMK